VLKGRGILISGGERSPFEPGDAIFVAPDEFHQFECDGDEELQFICVVPIQRG
jgi:quercetin dioxygenase-like cupin family protein